mmetsp:Transcript_16617/g.51742  ORF Transcript_16617/g.51742 Transcript_16617/m.51742 type:complete len:318 (+) Transcript_16617:1219-2172(+)
MRHHPALRGDVGARAAAPQSDHFVEDGDPAAVELERLALDGLGRRVEDVEDAQPARAAGVRKNGGDALPYIRELLVRVQRDDGRAQFGPPARLHRFRRAGRQLFPRRVAVRFGLVVPHVDVVRDFQGVALRGRPQREVVLFPEAVGKRLFVEGADGREDLGLDEEAEAVEDGHVDEAPARRARHGRGDGLGGPGVFSIGGGGERVLGPVGLARRRVDGPERGHGLVRRRVRQRADEADRVVGEGVTFKRLEPQWREDLRVRVEEAVRVERSRVARGFEPEVRRARVAVERRRAVPVHERRRQRGVAFPCRDERAEAF